MENQNKENQSRQIRAYAIISKGDEPVALAGNKFLVPSQSSDVKYTVSGSGLWSCECMDYQKRRQDCKHILAVQIWLKLREKLKKVEQFTVQEKIFEKPVCVFCKSFKVIKHGSRKCENMTKQRYFCNDCKKTFINDIEFRKFKGNAKIITLVMDVYFNGLSLRKIRNHLKQFYNFDVNHETVRQWIIRFTHKIAEYVDKLQPELSNTWHADEMVIKSKGKNVYVWNVLDENTRFLIANNITNGRGLGEAKQIFKKAKRTVNTIPTEIITDGLPAYPKAIRKVFRQNKQINGNVETKHIKYESIRAEPHNNKIERFHGTMREKDKIMRGWKGNKNAQVLLDGYRVWYNFVRPHQALNGLTPSQVAGLEIQNNGNKWISLIKTASNNCVQERQPIRKVTGYEIDISDKEGSELSDFQKSKFKTRFSNEQNLKQFLEFYKSIYSDLAFNVITLYNSKV